MDPILHQRLDGAWLVASWQASLSCHSGELLLPTGFYDALAWCALRTFNRAAEASQRIVHKCTFLRPGSWCQMCRLPACCDAAGQHQYPAGGDLGRHWHAAATRAGLPKRVEDLHACLLYLRRHLTQAAGRAAVVLHATSAGGVPAGAVLNLCPEVGCRSYRPQHRSPVAGAVLIAVCCRGLWAHVHPPTGSGHGRE